MASRSQRLRRRHRHQQQRKQYHWKQQLKVGEKHEKKRDYEEALAVYVETLAGFTAIGVERPNLAKKVADITRWIDEEATC